nr:chitinase-like protein PB1E7.04C [Ipomoea batatas]
MSMAEVDHIDLEVKGLSLLDDGAENDDFVLTLSPSPLKQTDNHKGLSLEMSGTMDVQEEDMDNKGEEDDVLPELHESMEPERSRRKGKLNLRKSLAWDSAFFTDAGVLDAEELSCMVKGAEKIEKNVMPRIEEDVERSTDTISTLASDSVALEHLEAELFEDIRASIQRSNKVSNVMTSTRKEVSSVADNGGNSASKKADATLKNVPKPKHAPKRAIGAQTLGMLKSQQKHTDGIQGSRKSIKLDNPRLMLFLCSLMKPVKTGDLTSSLAKLPKLPSKANPIPATMAKRASLSANHVKIDHDNTKTNTVAGKGAHTSKVFDSSNACKALPKPALSSKASSMRFSAASKMQSSRSSSDSTGSTLSDKAGKPNLPMARRKLVSKPVSQTSSASMLKTPSKTALKNRVSSGNSAISAYLMSSKINSSISPASLRMPSPKIGFFDGVKSVRTPNGTMQKQSTALPKIGTTLCSPNGRSNMKSKASGLPPSRMSTASGNVKSGTQNLSSPTSFQDKSQSPTLLNITDAPKDNQSFPSFAPEVHHEPKEESNSYVMDVGSGVHDTVKHVVQDAGLEAVNHGDLGVLKNEMTANVNEKANSNDIKVVAVEEETTYSNSKNADTTISEIAASRIPFAVKNSGVGDFLDFSKEAVVEEVVGKINSAIPPEIDYKENNNL